MQKKEKGAKTKSTKEKGAAGKTDGETAAFSVEKLRETYPNAYRPWSPDEDARLKNLFLEHLEFAEIAQTLGRKRGAIRSRLTKLGLIDKE